MVTQPLFGKCNAKLIKKGDNKFVAAIKSLQCSPRADGSDYDKLEDKTKKRKDVGKNNDSFSTKINNSPHSQQQEEHDYQKRSISNNLDLETILCRFSNLDQKTVSAQRVCNDLEIFTNDADDSLDDRVRNNNEQCDDNVDHLRNITRSSLDKIKESSHSQDMSKIGSSPLFSDNNDADGFPPTPRSKQKPLIQTEFSYFSNDSNDTPITCNKSLVSTPNNEHLYLRRKDEKDDGDDNEIFCKPPKELLHRSLSLGDAISPT